MYFSLFNQWHSKYFDHVICIYFFLFFCIKNKWRLHTTTQKRGALTSIRISFLRAPITVSHNMICLVATYIICFSNASIIVNLLNIIQQICVFRSQRYSQTKAKMNKRSWCDCVSNFQLDKNNCHVMWKFNALGWHLACAHFEVN